MGTSFEKICSPRPQRRLSQSLALVACALAVASCAPKARVVGGGAGPVLGAPVKLATGSVKADLAVVGDATQILRESASDSLGDAGMKCPGSGCPVVDLHARITRPASAFDHASPPVRVVELIARYHGSPGAPASATLSYQRTVAVPGNLSTATWMRVSDALMTDLVRDFSFRSRKSGIVIRLPSWATWPMSLSRAGTSRSFHVAVTGDGRADDDTIGNVGGREVRLARRATDYITEMLTDDLRAAGHTIVPARDGRLVGSQLEKFWIQTSGSQTTAEIIVALEVAPPAGVKRKKAEQHSCRVSENTGSRPSEPELARVLHKCLTALAKSMRNDSAWSLSAAPAATK